MAIRAAWRHDRPVAASRGERFVRGPAEQESVIGLLSQHPGRLDRGGIRRLPPQGLGGLAQIGDELRIVIQDQQLPGS